MIIDKKRRIKEGYKKHKSYEEKWGHLIIAGKWYKRGICDGKPMLIEVSDVEIALKKDLAKKFAKILKGKLDTETVLMERLMKLSPVDYEILSKLLLDKDLKPKSKEKMPKIKTRQHHCVDMKIGDDFWFQIC